MTLPDWIVISAYLVGMIALSVFLGRNQQNQEDYFVGGRKLPWWAVGLSTMATQTSAISFISIPAFVALKPGGGLTWLQYELAVPLAMIVVMVFLIPFFRHLELVSVYEYLEDRYSPAVRYFVSMVFLVSRGLGTGVGVYASGIVLSVCLNVPLYITILLIGVVTIIYDTIGGISAVVYSDVIQMGVLLGGILLSIYYAADMVGGLSAVWHQFPLTRRSAIDAALGVGDGSAVPFWAFLIGGFFLYTSYYGTDQSQVQRELSAGSTAETKWSLVFNGLARFPLTLLYVAMGMAVWTVYDMSPDFATRVPFEKPDYLVPQYVLYYLPAGVRGLLFAALLAAAMSSLDSALNSLSAATVRDFIGRRVSDPKRLLLMSKLTTVGWGIAITGFAFLVGRISDTVIEAINKIGSAFYGPILATFLMGVLFRKVNTAGILLGAAAGVVFNIWLWVTQPGVHWMWWNVTGFVVASVLAYGVSLVWPLPYSDKIDNYVLHSAGHIRKEVRWIPVYVLLLAYFALILYGMYRLGTIG